MYICHIFFIHSSVKGHLGCFRFLAIVNSTAVTTEIHVFFKIRVFSRYMPRSGIAGSYGKSTSGFLRNQIYFWFFKEPPYCFPLSPCWFLIQNEAKDVGQMEGQDFAGFKG